MLDDLNHEKTNITPVVNKLNDEILNTQNEKVFENSFVSYRNSNLSFLCFIIFQNVPLIQNIEEDTIVIFYGDHHPYITNSKGENIYLNLPYFQEHI